jgi:3-hydroxyacyl-CoA dehydrogenase
VPNSHGCKPIWELSLAEIPAKEIRFLQPFKLLDFIGLDTASHIVSGWEDKAEKGLIEKSAVQPVRLLQKMIAEGRLGRKSGRGFYDVSQVEGP